MDILRNMNVNGVLSPINKTLNFDREKGALINYSGHFIHIKYNLFILDNTVYMDDREDVDEHGNFNIRLPKNDIIPTPLLIEVYAPDGDLIFNGSYSYSALFPVEKDKNVKDKSKNIFEIPVDPKELIASKPEILNIQGQLVDSSASKRMSNIQIVFWVADLVDLEDDSAIAICFTKQNGKFSVQIPNKEYSKAYVTFTGNNDFHLPIKINKLTNTIEKELFIITDFSDIDVKEFTDIKASLPDHDELVNSSKFSQDLGGKCVDFTVPNRTLDEFSFYHVVRTSEPEIRRSDFSRNDTSNFKEIFKSISENAFAEFNKLVSSFESIVPAEIDVSEQESESEVGKECKEIEIFNKIVEICNKIDNQEENKKFQEIVSQCFKRDCKKIEKVLTQDECKSLSAQLKTIKTNKTFLSLIEPHNKNLKLESSISQLEQISPIVTKTTVKTTNKIVNIAQLHAIKIDAVPMSLGELKREFNLKSDLSLMRALNLHKEQNKKLEVLKNKLRLAFCAKDGYRENKEYCSSMYKNDDDFCKEEIEEVQGLLCVKQKYEDLKTKIDNKPILSLEDLFEAEEYCSVFIRSIDNFIYLLEEFYNIQKYFILRTITNKYFMKAYSDIKEKLKNYKNDIEKLDKKLKDYKSRYIENHPGRQELSAEVSIDWDDTPTIYQNTTIAHGHILHFKQKWKADGYSLGDLLYSLPLAPCQEKQIAILDWDRTERGGRVEEQIVSDSIDAIISRDRDIHENASSIFNESIRANSKNKTSSKSAGIGGGLGGVFDSGAFGIAGGVSYSGASSSSSAAQNSSRNISASSMQGLRDTTQQSASAMRSTRSATIETVSQNETVTAQTEVIKNHSHCHSMTVEYFQVLRHYAIEEELVDVQECLFVPLPMTLFDTQKALRWKNTLGSAINSRYLQKGFKALEREGKDYVNDLNLPAGTYAQEPINEFSGYFYISFDLVRPPIDEIDDATKKVTINFKNFFPWFVNRTWSIDVALNDEEKNVMFEKSYAPDIVRSFIDTLLIVGVDGEGNKHNLELDLTLLSNYKKGQYLKVQIASQKANLNITREQIKYILIRAKTEVMASSKIILRSFYLHYKTQYSNEVIVQNSSVNNDIITKNVDEEDTIVTDAALIYTPLNTQELKNPKKEDEELASTLLKFLNEHLELAHNAIWSNMDNNRIFGLLDGYIAPNSKTKSVASVVENKVMGVVGNNLVFKVAPGHRLDPLYKNIDLIEHYQPTTKPDPYRISIPTRGVYSEAVLGKCNSCEEIDESRFWRFDEAPCGSKATDISTLSTDTRRSQPSNLQTKDMPSSIINMQTTPSASDPTGLASLYALMGKGGSFADMTGLSGTQANALSALQTTSKSVTDLANISKDFANLAVMNDSKQSTPREINDIKKLNKEGYLSDDETNQLIKSKLGVKQQAVDNLTKSDGESADVVNSTVSKAMDSGIIGKTSSFELESKDGEKIKVDNSKASIENISAVTMEGQISGGLGDANDVFRLPKKIDKEKPNALALLTYNDTEIMKYTESIEDISRIEKQYNTFMVAVKTSKEFTDAHLEASKYFFAETGKRISFFYIHAHGSSQSITLSKNNQLLASSLAEMNLSQYYENGSKGIVNACLTAVNYYSNKYNKLTSFAQEIANSMKASIKAPITLTYGSLTDDLQLVQKNEYYKSGFNKNNTGYFLTSEGYIFLVYRFKTDEEMIALKDALENKHKEKILVVEIPLKKDQPYAYLMSYYFSEESETKYTNNINLNIDEFNPDEVFDRVSEKGKMIIKEFFKDILPTN